MNRPTPRRVLMLGATGTIGRATVRALVARGHDVICFVRSSTSADSASFNEEGSRGVGRVTMRTGNVGDPRSIARDGICDEHFDAVVSCMASRTGTPRDAWAIDHQAHVHVLQAAKAAGATQFVLLSAICVQKPLLAFQHAKLAFEQALMSSGLTWSIVRPTAFFKSLSGQIARVQAGKPFLVFGDGNGTACKPISDDDLATYIADCLHNPQRFNQILPIGGPGEALTPRQQGEQLFALVGKPPRFTHVPVALLDVIVAVLGTLGKVISPLADKAQLARIGRYYATESMLVWDAASQRYDAAATPSTGRETLADFYAKRIKGETRDDRGEHAVF